MKAKLILIGGCISWLVLLAGVGTLEFGEGDGCHELLGILLCFVGGILQLLFLQHQKELGELADRWVEWIDEYFFGISKNNN